MVTPDIQYKKCVKCPKGCAACIYNQQTFTPLCYVCEENYFLDIGTNVCENIVNCTDNLVVDMSSNTCREDCSVKSYKAEWDYETARCIPICSATQYYDKDQNIC